MAISRRGAGAAIPDHHLCVGARRGQVSYAVGEFGARGQCLEVLERERPAGELCELEGIGLQ